MTFILIGFMCCNCAQPVPESVRKFQFTRSNLDPEIWEIFREISKKTSNLKNDPELKLRIVEKRIKEISDEPWRYESDVSLDYLERDIIFLEEIYAKSIKIKNHLVELEQKLGDEFFMYSDSYSFYGEYNKYGSLGRVIRFVDRYEKAAPRENFNKKVNERAVLRTEKKNKEDLLSDWASERKKLQNNLISKHVGAAVTDDYSLSVYAVEKRWVTFFIKATGNKIIRFKSREYTTNEVTGETTGYWSGYSMKDNHGNHYKFEGISESIYAEPGKFRKPGYSGKREVVLRPGQGHLMIAQFSDYPVQSDSLTISAYPRGLGRHDFEIPTEIWHQCSDVPIKPPVSFTPN